MRSKLTLVWLRAFYFYSAQASVACCGFSWEKPRGLGCFRLIQISFLECSIGQHLKHRRTIGSEAGFLAGSTQQPRRDGVKVAQDVSPG